MYIDVTALRAFYESTLGKEVQHRLKLELQDKNLFQKGQVSVGMGYALPYFPKNLTNKAQCLAFMPARQGVLPWPSIDKNFSALVEESLLPLKDQSIDAFFLIHILEFSQNASALLQEIWRVLVPNGRLLIVVPNRKGLWSFYENTPFGHGVPYSRIQLQNLLQKNNLTPLKLWESLHFLPKEQGILRFLSSFHMHLAASHLPYFGGVLLAEAKKDLYRPITVPQPKQKKIRLNDFSLETVPPKPT